MKKSNLFEVRAARSDYATGVALLVIAAVTYSTAGLFTKGVLAGAWAVIFWRGLFAAIFTVGWTVYQGSFRENFFKMGVSGWAIGVIGAAGVTAFIPAFKLTSIANVALIYAAAPMLAASLAWLVIRERITRRTLVGAILALLGVAIIFSGSVGAFSLTGDALALVMTLVMAVIFVIYRMRPETPGAGPAAMQSILLLPLSFYLGAPLDVATAEIAILAAFGLLFAIASVTVAEGAKRVPAGQTALIGALETPLAPILAFFILSEVPNTQTFVGGALVLAAVVLSIERS